jgi:cell division protein FtsL
MHKRKGLISIIVLLMLVIIGYMCVLLIQQQSMIDANKAKISQANSKINEELVLQDKLKYEKDHLLTSESIERIAREVLGMVKPGERIYIEADK